MLQCWSDSLVVLLQIFALLQSDKQNTFIRKPIGLEQECDEAEPSRHREVSWRTFRHRLPRASLENKNFTVQTSCSGDMIVTFSRCDSVVSLWE